MMPTIRHRMVGMLLSVGAAALLQGIGWQAWAAPSGGRVAGGKTVDECAFPGVIMLSNCTATLVHPKLVVYAAHCGSNQSKITFTNGQQSRSVATDQCATNPQYQNETTDWAYCVLAEEVTDLPVIPVAYGCEWDMLVLDNGDVVQCGVGRSDDGGANFGTKRYGNSKISSVPSSTTRGTIQVGPHEGVVACPGDSGGPLLARLPDKSWRTIGITSTYNNTCGEGGMNWYAWLGPDAVEWIETDSGIDVTPCFNDMGEWEPGPACGGFFAGEPGASSGTWDDWCEGTAKSGPSTTCGGQEDSQAPTIAWETPKDGDTFDEGDAVEIEVLAEDDIGITTVGLLVDGKAEADLTTGPFVWKISDLKVGDHKLEAHVIDQAGNEAKTPVITIEIIGPDIPTDDSDDDDDDDDSSDTHDHETDDDDDDDDNDDGADDDDDNADDDDDDTSETEAGDDDDDDNADDDDDDGKDDPNSEDLGGGDTSKLKRRGCAVSGSLSDTTTWLMVVMIGAWMRRRKC